LNEYHSISELITDVGDYIELYNYRTKSNPISTQSNLFHSELFSQLDVKDPLIQLANTINWTVFDDAFEQHYSQDNSKMTSLADLVIV
jgi:hypothetical protein